MIATGIHLVPVSVVAAAIVSVRPSAIATLDDQLPAVLLAVASAVVPLRRAPRRADN